MGLPLAAQAQKVVAGAVDSGTTAAGGVDADQQVPKHGWFVTPTVAVSETLTDNLTLRSTRKTSDLITEVRPGLRIDGDTARSKFHLDYQMRNYIYAQESDRNRARHALRSAGNFEAVENWLFVDVSGVVTQQGISPFGLQSFSNSNINRNVTEASRFMVSPHVRGELGGFAEYELRYDRSTAQADSARLRSVDMANWNGRIYGDVAHSPLGWSMDAGQRTVDYSTGRHTEADQVRGRLSYRVIPELSLSASLGREANNYASLDKESHRTHGFGFDWRPLPRTQISAFREQRFFGAGHTFSLAHRTPLSSIRLADARSETVLPNQLGVAGLGTIYDLMFAQLEASIPDPVDRAQYVNNLLQQLGMDPNTQVTSGFLTTRVSLVRRQELAYTLQGVRNVLTLAAVRNQHEALGPGSGSTADIFATTPTIRQRGYLATLMHKLTPLSSLNFMASMHRNTGISTTGNNLSADIKTFHVNYSTHLGPHTLAALGARHTIFDGTSRSYTENAVIGTVSLQF